MRSFLSFCFPAMVVVAAIVGDAGRAVGQDPKYSSWKQVEAAPETREFLSTMKGGGSLDGAAMTYLEEIVFPQFTLPDNRADLDEVRNRLRTRILGSFATDEIQNAANQLVVDGMQRLIDDDRLEMGVRLNAVLLIGELDAKSGGLWPGAVQPLAAVASDASSPLSLRVAAMIGLGQHLSRAANRSDPAILAGMLPTAEPALIASLEMPETGTPSEQVAAEWLASMVLRLLPDVMPKASPEVAGRIFTVLADDARGLDVRVRAAYALGTTAAADANIDVTESVAIVEALAIESLASDVALADERAFERDFLGGGGGPPGGFGGPGGMMSSDSGMAGMSMGPGRMGPGGMGPRGMGPGGMRGPGGGFGGEEGPGEADADRGGRGGRNSRGGRGGEEQQPGRGPGSMRGGMGSGGMMGSGMMGSGGRGFGRSRRLQPLLESGICLRTAWRLQTLADSLAVGEPAETGFVMPAAEDEKPGILELAAKLRAQAGLIQESPTDRSIREAFAVVAPELASPPEEEPELPEDEMAFEGGPGDGGDDVFGSDVFGNPPAGGPPPGVGPGGPGGGRSPGGPGGSPRRPGGPQQGGPQQGGPQQGGPQQGGDPSQGGGGDEPFDPFGE